MRSTNSLTYLLLTYFILPHFLPVPTFPPFIFPLFPSYHRLPLFVLFNSVLSAEQMLKITA